MKGKMCTVMSVAAATLLSASAWAGPGGCGVPHGGFDMPMGRPAGMKFDPAQRAERHLDFLKYQLRITPEQEPLWQAYAEKVKAEAGKGWRERSELALDDLSAPDRLSRMEKLMEERLAAMKDIHARFARLYETLSPEQRAHADRYVGRGMGWMQPKLPAPQPKG